MGKAQQPMNYLCADYIVQVEVAQECPGCNNQNSSF